MVNEVSGSKGVGVPQSPPAGYNTHRGKEVNSVFDKDKPNNDGVVKKALDANQEISERMHDLKAKVDDIRDAMRNLDVKKQDSQDSRAFDLSKVSPEMLEKIKEALKNGDLSALDGLKGKSINKQEAPKTVDKLPTDVWQGPYTKDGPDIQLF